jgi:hypothetical protein
MGGCGGHDDGRLPAIRRVSVLRRRWRGEESASWDSPEANMAFWDRNDRNAEVVGFVRAIQMIEGLSRLDG